MSFNQAIASGTAPATGPALPASTSGDIWAIFRTLRDVASRFELGPKVMQTLSAMLSCLKPGRGTVCFASNHELQRRLAGVSDKTIRRHIAELSSANVLRRQDSPNGKRYSTRDPLTGEVEAYGLDLSPMVENADRWAQALEAQQEMEARIKHLRTMILARLAWCDSLNNVTLNTPELRKVLRRSTLQIADLEAMLATVEDELQCSSEASATRDDNPTSDSKLSYTISSVSGGQNDRDYSKSNTEDKDLDNTATTANESSDEEKRLLEKLKIVCPEAMTFAFEPISTWSEMERHASILAPMSGFSSNLYQVTLNRLGRRNAAITVLLMVQMHGKIRNMEAYVRSLVLGHRSGTFNPVKLLDRLFVNQCA